jgi:hypothetical protein
MWCSVSDLAGGVDEYFAARLGPSCRRSSPSPSLTGPRAARRFRADQRIVAGLGNIYADEALWHARLHPLRPGGSLEGKEVAALRRGIRHALRRGIARQDPADGRIRSGDGDEFRATGATVSVPSAARRWRRRAWRAARTLSGVPAVIPRLSDGVLALPTTARRGRCTVVLPPGERRPCEVAAGAGRSDRRAALPASGPRRSSHRRQRLPAATASAVFEERIASTRADRAARVGAAVYTCARRPVRAPDGRGGIRGMRGGDAAELERFAGMGCMVGKLPGRTAGRRRSGLVSAELAGGRT